MFSVIFVLGLLYHTYTDLKSMLLYDKTTLILAAVGLVRAWYERQLFDAAYGAGIILAIMLVLYFASRGGMGERFPSDRFCVRRQSLHIFGVEKSLHGIGGCSYDEVW